MFWGGGRLQNELPHLISDYNVERLDCASYRLRVGPEVYVTPTGAPEDPRNKPKTQLHDEQPFAIPAGQFGFILTEETVRVPESSIAFISIRASYKFQGLVNVSGFHVDPHYEGRLLFSVFNAGPTAVHLHRGEECFLIWYADLDQHSSVDKKIGHMSIPSKLTGPLSRGLESFAGLNSKIDENEKKISARLMTMEREQAVIKWAAVLVVGAIITLGVRECSISSSNSSSPATISESTSTPSGAAPP